MGFRFSSILAKNGGSSSGSKNCTDPIKNHWQHWKVIVTKYLGLVGM